MSQHTLRKLFILTLILTYLTNSTAALAGSCGDIAKDPSCDNICQCAEDKSLAFHKTHKVELRVVNNHKVVLILQQIQNLA